MIDWVGHGPVSDICWDYILDVLLLVLLLLFKLGNVWFPSDPCFLIFAWNSVLGICDVRLMVFHVPQFWFQFIGGLLTCWYTWGIGKTSDLVYLDIRLCRVHCVMWWRWMTELVSVIFFPPVGRSHALEFKFFAKKQKKKEGKILILSSSFLPRPGTAASLILPWDLPRRRW